MTIDEDREPTWNETEQMRWEEIVDVRKDLAAALTEVGVQERRAIAALDRLSEADLYDIEIEGEPDEGIRSFLADIRLAAAAAAAMLYQVRRDER